MSTKYTPTTDPVIGECRKCGLRFIRIHHEGVGCIRCDAPVFTYAEEKRQEIRESERKRRLG